MYLCVSAPLRFPTFAEVHGTLGPGGNRRGAETQSSGSLVFMRQLHVVFLGAVGFLAAAAPAWSWGCEGHQTVALIAKKHLQPAATKKVNELLNTHPIDP